MTERTTASEITFSHPFILGSLVVPLDAGTYRLIVDEELIEGLSFPAYRRTGTHLEIPAVGVEIGTRQLLQVPRQELEAAMQRDAEDGEESLASQV
ncbi:hypothetical protein IB244_22275 [Rhizobium sp. RHZ02]|jgi:hypothetical protein|uniref:hypothetical protein n=1 Tax=Rhizobium sp. RHZ02 TaxID=2769306 RepID=UPI0017869260|nr:hypothetical protein [Rhizobium sp. RHZ02]MBD9454235.1 hypothetical protein [Rhizobium sp. RHZ02]